MNSSSNLSLRERREAVVREHIAPENAHDISRAIATFHHPRYEVAPFGSVNDGAQAVHDLIPWHMELRYICLTRAPTSFIMIVATSSAVLTAIALIDPGYRSIALTQAVSLLAGAY